MSSKIAITKSTGSFSDNIERLKRALHEADAVVIGAGAGLSTSAGFTYSGERFERYFSEFGQKYGFADMYTGGFYPYKTPEEMWAYWSRFIFVNRYMDAPKPVYEELYRLVKDKDYFVLTTNVDHCFQKAGFEKKRLFYTQGDYGLFQCTKPCCRKTWENEEVIRRMILSQGYAFGPRGELVLPEGKTAGMTIPSSLVPRCPNCGRLMTMNLRSDEKFVEDEGWKAAAVEYEAWLTTHREANIVYLEIGVGYNTPGIIKYNFWQQVYQNPNAVYACLNMEEDPVPREIEERSIVIGGDSAVVIRELIA